jgi:hypothetical protein
MGTTYHSASQILIKSHSSGSLLLKQAKLQQKSGKSAEWQFISVNRRLIISRMTVAYLPKG